MGVEKFRARGVRALVFSVHFGADCVDGILGSEVRTLRLGPVSTRWCHAAFANDPFPIHLKLKIVAEKCRLEAQAAGLPTPGEMGGVFVVPW